MGRVLCDPVDGGAAGWVAEIGGAGASASRERGGGEGGSPFDARYGSGCGFLDRVVSGSARSGSARVVLLLGRRRGFRERREFARG